MNALEVKKLKKVYSGFTLGELSFTIQEGQIAGLIGRNGAGKSTTLKSLMRLISSEGEVSVFGRRLSGEDKSDYNGEDSSHDRGGKNNGDKGGERYIKELIGYVGGGFRFYSNKTLAAVARSVARFYPRWDGETFSRLCGEYSLTLSKKVRELSEGMKVKFSLALALSHGARLLILDEPTSGLDPFSREDFCDALLALRERGATVLFSTHITSDLLRVADRVLYLSEGKLLADEELESLLKRYRIKVFETLAQAEKAGATGAKAVKGGFEGLMDMRASGRDLYAAGEPVCGVNGRPRGGVTSQGEADCRTAGGADGEVNHKPVGGADGEVNHKPVGGADDGREATLDEIMIHLEYARRARE